MCRVVYRVRDTESGRRLNESSMIGHAPYRTQFLKPDFGWLHVWLHVLYWSSQPEADRMAETTRMRPFR